MRIQTQRNLRLSCATPVPPDIATTEVIVRLSVDLTGSPSRYARQRSLATWISGRSIWRPFALIYLVGWTLLS